MLASKLPMLLLGAMIGALGVTVALAGGGLLWVRGLMPTGVGLLVAGLLAFAGGGAMVAAGATRMRHTRVPDSWSDPDADGRAEGDLVGVGSASTGGRS